MLRKATVNDFRKHIEFAYSLALDLETSSYPTYLDGIKTKEDFKERAYRAFADGSNEEILIFEYNGRVEGWIHYYVIPEDKYLSFCAFNVSAGMDDAVTEFIAYARNMYEGYTVHFGFPGENEQALTALQRVDCRLEETACVHAIALNAARSFQNTECTERVDEASFDDFAALHAIHDDDMYWNNKRLREALAEWEIWMLRDCDGHASAAVYWCEYDQTMMEIFGFDYRENCFNEKSFSNLMIRALNSGKEHGVANLVYFASLEECSTLTALGFRYISRYVLYSCIL